MRSSRYTFAEKEPNSEASELPSSFGKSQVRAASITKNLSSPRRTFAAGDWKPVIDGKLQAVSAQQQQQQQQQPATHGVIESRDSSSNRSRSAELVAASSMQQLNQQSTTATSDGLVPPFTHSSGKQLQQPLVHTSTSASISTVLSKEKKSDGASGEEANSDHELCKVPDISCKMESTAGSGVNVATSLSGQSLPSRRRSGLSADKEHKRLKRLLRNRVSAQQARERKKAYVSELEFRSRDLEQKNANLEERVSTLIKENVMLRQIIKNTAMKNGGGAAGGSNWEDN